MCQFFSLISDGRGNIKYFDWKVRQSILAGALPGYDREHMDSHSSIASYYKVNEDKHNKWEYNPLTCKLVKDQLNTLDDELWVADAVAKLDFKTIVPQLVIKPIVHPFKVKRANPVPTVAELRLLKQWASVVDSVWAAVAATRWGRCKDSLGRED